MDQNHLYPLKVGCLEFWGVQYMDGYAKVEPPQSTILLLILLHQRIWPKDVSWVYRNMNALWKVLTINTQWFILSYFIVFFLVFMIYFVLEKSVTLLISKQMGLGDTVPGVCKKDHDPKNQHMPLGLPTE